MSVDYDRTDPTFVADLMQSNNTVWLVAQWLQSRGYPVTVKPLRVRPSVDERHEFADSGDLEIIQRVEVKRRNIHFTGAHDYPYQDGVIVDVTHTWNKATPKPAAYVIVNAPGTHLAVVTRATAQHWHVMRKWDRHCNRTRSWYVCPIDLVEFRSLVVEM